MRNLRLDVCYDGTRYKGWQRLSPGDNTIQGRLETLLSRLLGEPIEVSGSGRTDAGTHARGQVASFHCNSTMTCEDILSGLRMYLPEDIGVYSCKDVSPRFHARLNAKEKTYCYRVWNADTPCVFERKFVYKDTRNFDLLAMQSAAQNYVGTHDFSAFCSNKHMKKSTVRQIESVTISREGEELIMSFTADGFLYNMVRIMVGTLVEVGLGKRSAETIPALFGAKREEAGALVPAQGLCLMEVNY